MMKKKSDWKEKLEKKKNFFFRDEKMQKEIEKEKIKERIRLDREIQRDEARRRLEEEEAAKKLQQPHVEGGILSWSAPSIQPVSQNTPITPPVRASADDIDEEIKPRYKSTSAGFTVPTPTSPVTSTGFTTLGSLKGTKVKKKMTGLYRILLNIIKKVVRHY